MCMAFPIGFGQIMYVKYGLHSDHWNLLDTLISFGTMINIVQSVPTLILVTYRNLFGPPDNLNLIFATFAITTFGRISFFMTVVSEYLVWYIIEKVLKNLNEIDEIGMVECVIFFNIVLSGGLTFLVSSVAYNFHQVLTRYIGLPLDFGGKYLVKTR